MNCRIMDHLFDVVKHLQYEQKAPRDYDIGQPLFYAEISVLRMVDANPGLKMSAIAQQLGITRGAATQHVAKLTAKNLLELYQQDTNKKEKYLRLTPLGRQAVEGHRRLHAKANNNLCTYFRSLNPAEVTTITAFLNQLDDNMPFCDFMCDSNGRCTDVERTKQ